ncbi:T6SS immunity protein Tli4 family protein [Acinetobacter pollinis]|uniref:T6SS immunity protein Tli4 family protein n=1 Tax=Acinetobacter pollinis TaxID=2605270 RepID=UPI0018A2580D|nr:T6SS immunity protein Tli4 family protein [Acinetobacter pollinis]MBF7689631.1 hypothetical protein [Acinetobacter pollinis]MBF7692651.1 hypothetical protein [Acinetobacter pollinis]MBF7700659.1 hypothetical protein [Acinetobacter pollinis]
MKLKDLTLCFMAILSLTACSNEQKQQKGIQPMNFDKPKTLCLGRIEIDVPQETTVIIDDFNYNGSTYSINTDIQSYAEYQNFIANRIQEFKSQPHETEGTLLSKEMAGPTKDDRGRSNSHIIVYRSTEYSKNIYNIEAYIYIRPGTMLVLKSGASTNLLSRVLDHLDYNLRNTHPRTAENRNQPGYCWGDFFIFDDMTLNHVWGGSHLYLRFPSYPRVDITLEHRVRLESDEPLIQLVKKRTAQIPLSLRALMKVNTLKEEKKTIHGFAGEELIQHLSTRGYFERGYELGTWQYLGDLQNNNDPFIQLELESAVHREYAPSSEHLNSTVSQKSVLRLYNFIRDSIRLSEPNQKRVQQYK